MMLPPLTADVSLYRSMANYRSSWPAGNTSGIAPSQALAPGAFQPSAKMTNRQRCIFLGASLCTLIGSAGVLGALGSCAVACAASGPLLPACDLICDGFVAEILFGTLACNDAVKKVCTNLFGSV
jgi:hypothetical protein